MELTDKQIDLLKRRKIIALATSSLQGKPQVTFVEINKINSDQIIITDNEMFTTRKNLLKNKQVAILSFEEDYNYCLRISGEANYYNKGKYFDFVKNLKANQNQSPKGAIVIDIKNVIEFK